MDFRLTGRLCKAARALAGMNQAQLARAANVAKQTVADFERGARTPYANNRRAIQRALEEADVVFVTDGKEGPGVRLSKRGPAIADRSSPGRRKGADGSKDRSPASRAPALTDADDSAQRSGVASKDMEAMLGDLRRVLDRYDLPSPLQAELLAFLAGRDKA